MKRDEINSALFETDGSILKGKCNHSEKAIYICDALNEDTTNEVVIHELTHAFIMQCLLNKNEFNQEDVCLFLQSYIDKIYSLSLDVNSFYYEKIGVVINNG